MPESNIFGSDQNAEPSLDQIIGENGKYKTQEDAAKALLEKDRFIDQLKAENKTAREALDKTSNVETLLQELIKKQNAAPPAVKPPESTGSSASSAQLTEKDLADRIRQVTQQVSVEDRKASNINEVALKMVEVFGSSDKAREIVAAKARELGVPTDFLQQTAAQSPTGFYTLLGITESASAQRSVQPNQRLNTEAVGRNKTGGEPDPDTYAYFQQLAKTNIREYLSPKVQNRMHKLAMENPEKFGAPDSN